MIKMWDEYVEDKLCGFLVTNSLWLDMSEGFLEIFNIKNYKYVDKDMPILFNFWRFGCSRRFW